MTALQLLTYIGVALALQIAAGIALFVWRRRAVAALPAPSEQPLARASSASASSAGAWSGWREFRVTRRSVEDAAQTQCSFDLHPVDGLPLPAFEPGQFLTFSLPASGAPQGGENAAHSVTRCYSLSDRPDPASYRITVKRVPAPVGRPDLPPGAASNYFHDRVRVGEVLKVKAPAGRFFIDSDATVPAVLIAGGIGITPLLSMLRWCAVMQPGRTVHLFYGVRNGAEHAFRQALRELAESLAGLRLHVVYSCPGPDDIQGRDYHHRGHIGLDLLRNSLPPGRHRFYVCGPGPMMQSLVPALRTWGVAEDDIRFEAFGPASVQPVVPGSNEPLAATATSLEVRFDRSGRSLVWDGRDANLLDFAQRHGVAVESGCRSGSCGTCETGVVSGDVHYSEEPGHEIATGCCLLCIGKPQSSLVLDL